MAFSSLLDNKDAPKVVHISRYILFLNLAKGVMFSEINTIIDISSGMRNAKT